ncbi:DUF4186 family protein [Sodalis glossinidius]|uniref:DUF4186 family protein n=1 Tax=Sodalis glossinidius TaxID=63612 RepID=UPI00031A2FE6|nr:DUF4186 family protein [Sodalis glossinidius]
MTQDARDKEQIWQHLQQSAFRRRFSLNPRDNDYMHAKGMTVILDHARDFIASRLAPVFPAKDGKQTPWLERRGSGGQA